MAQIYLVGGAVRDKLLGLPVKDKDWVVVGSSPDELMAQGFLPVGRDFPVFLHPKTHEEYALARTERKISKGYAGFAFDTSSQVSLEDDLSRRDLTINAMAEDSSGSLIDPFGGQKDLQNKILRHVSPAFAEDPVRILRTARFAARYGFQVAPETMCLMKNMVENGEVSALVPERVWQEISRGLMEKTPSKMFAVLKECGALAVILPEINALYGVPQRADYHPEIDCAVHTLMAVDYAAQHNFSLPERYATLTHDLGKALTPSDILPKHHGHEKAGIEPVKTLNKRLNVPKDCAKLALLVVEYHGKFHSLNELRPATIVDILHKTDAFRQPEKFISAVKIGFADTRGRLTFENALYPQFDHWQEILKICQEIDIQSIIQSVTDKSQIPEKIRQVRIAAVKEWKKKVFQAA
ncbi:MAG: multifunctional CCA addition/repair protein [Neisseriaceae bacterium]|nr:multifunctional CCA addition/repair protein [Neisseriaceae bacterium]